MATRASGAARTAGRVRALEPSRQTFGFDVACQDQCKLLERERQLHRLCALLDEAAAGRAASGVIVLEGPAGIGKTALLGAVAREAAGRGYTVLRARGSEFERSFSFGIARQLFLRRIHEEPDESRKQ